MPTGALTGITSISTPDFIQFNTSATVTPANGMIWWDGGNALNVQMGTSVESQINEDAYIYAKASSAITKGELCYFTGVVGASSAITAAPAIAGITNAQYIIGIAAESISLGNFGLIQTFGSLKGFDTSAFVTGDILYYDSASGGMTSTYPTTGIIVTVAAVTYAGSGGSGSVQIRPQVTQRILGTANQVSVSQTSAAATISLPSSVTVGTLIATTGVFGGTF